MVESPPVKAGDTVSIPDPRKIPHGVEWLSPCTTTTEPASKAWEL